MERLLISLVGEKGSIKSDNVKATYDGSKWTLAGTHKYSPKYQYFAYYPYRSAGLGHVTGTVASGITAATFFASGISSFSVQTNQSTAANFNASDLQVGKATISRTTADDISFDLTHQMGLAVMTVGATKTVPTDITINGNTGATTSQSSETTTLTTSTAFSGNTPYKTKTTNLYAAIIKPSTNTTFLTTTSGAVTGWSHEFNISANNNSSYTVAIARQGYNIIWNYEYSGESKTFNIPCPGKYKIECWGAQGGSQTDDTSFQGGKGAYTTGICKFPFEFNIYLYVGQCGDGIMKTRTFNGGGFGGEQYTGYSGGGSTDIRITSGAWNNFGSLKSRIMVAAGGGGSNGQSSGSTELSGTYYCSGGYGGSLTGDSGSWGTSRGEKSTVNPDAPYTVAGGGQQTAGGNGGGGTPVNKHLTYTFGSKGSFGMGGNATYISEKNGGGGGGGYYGGGGGGYDSGVVGSGGGGSSFISGYTGCNAIAESSTESNIVHTGQANHYSGYVFTNMQMIAGNASMPSPSGGTETGHSGNGYARITFVP